MTMPILQEKGFAARVIDALSSHICVVDETSAIVAVNRAWRNFAVDNPPASGRTGVGVNYLEICRNSSGPGSEGAREFAAGLESVLVGDSELFQMEYPCHSPTQNRWFLTDVTPLQNGHRGAVVSHVAITDRKLLELELARLAATDPLTGLPNRRHFMEVANLEIERAARFGTPASVVMADLDHFKAVNDRYGHAVGDEALRRFSQICGKPLRKIDLFARIGGEEFAILLPGTTEASAAGVAEKLRLVLSGTPIDGGQTMFNMTASFGVTEARAEDISVDACLGRADAALYAAKREGRNRVVRFGAMPREADVPGS